MDDLPPIDAILLSHNHYDHLHIATLHELYGHHGARIITRLGNDSIIHRKIPAARIETGDWYDSFAIVPGADAHILPTLHWAFRSPQRPTHGSLGRLHA